VHLSWPVIDTERSNLAENLLHNSILRDAGPPMTWTHRSATRNNSPPLAVAPKLPFVRDHHFAPTLTIAAYAERAREHRCITPSADPQPLTFGSAAFYIYHFVRIIIRPTRKAKAQRDATLQFIPEDSNLCEHRGCGLKKSGRCSVFNAAAR